MEFYEEKDACRLTLRDPRQMHIKYMYLAKESFQLFSSQLFPLRKHTHTNSGLAGLQNCSYNILLIRSRGLIGWHGQVLEKYSSTFLKLLNKLVVHEKFAKQIKALLFRGNATENTRVRANEIFHNVKTQSFSILV